MNLPKVIIFDLAGTLIDTAPAVEEAANRVRERKNLGPVSSELVLRVLAGKAVETDLLVPINAGGKDRRDALMLYGRYLDVVFPDYAVPYEGISDTFRIIQKRVPRLSVIANAITLFLYQWLDFAGWSDFFDPIVGADSVPHPIPSADAFQFVLRRIRTPASAGWFVSDSASALLAARNAGLTPVGSRYGYGQPESSDADEFLEFPADLIRLLDRPIV